MPNNLLCSHNHFYSCCNEHTKGFLNLNFFKPSFKKICHVANILYRASLEDLSHTHQWNTSYVYSTVLVEKCQIKTPVHIETDR